MKKSMVARMIAQSMLMHMPLVFDVPNVSPVYGRSWGNIPQKRNGQRKTFKMNRRHQIKHGFKSKRKKR